MTDRGQQEARHLGDSDHEVPAIGCLIVAGIGCVILAFACYGVWSIWRDF